MQRIYMDYAATTPVDERVLQAMLPFFRAQCGNASSAHEEGRRAAKALDHARRQVAETLGAQIAEIVFTSGGTEADNLAIGGVAQALSAKGRHIITTAIEHPAVLNACKALEERGWQLTYLPVCESGAVTAGQVRDALRPDTVLVSVMAANNEIGTIQPIAEIGAVCKGAGVLFHTDAVQAVGALAMDVEEMNIDLLSLSAHKFYGPKGTGALYVRKGTVLFPQMMGGAQERNRRAGTENVPGIVGLGEAIALAVQEIDMRYEKLHALRERMVAGVKREISDAVLNGEGAPCLPGIVSFAFAGVSTEQLVARLDMEGIAASGGAACEAGSAGQSHVMKAIGRGGYGAVRFSLGSGNTAEEVDTAVERLAFIIAALRK